MPAPLGKTPTKKMPKIEVFGLEGSAPTRAAVRFFRERRIVVRFVDLSKRPIDASELRGFIDRLGAAALLDAPIAESPATNPAMNPAPNGPPNPAPNRVPNRGALLARIRADAGLLRLPLVRYGDEVTAGQDETTWRVWLARTGRR